MGNLTKTTAQVQTILDNTVRKDEIEGGQVILGKISIGDEIYTNPYGIDEKLQVHSSSVFDSSESSFGLASHATPGRVLTISGLSTVKSPNIEGIGLDVHPILTATGNNQTLIGIWVDPSGPNGESMFNLGAFTGVRSTGILNVQGLEQRGDAFFFGNIVGLNGANIAVGNSYGITKILGIGNIGGGNVQTHDVASGAGGSVLYGVQAEPVFLNTGAVGAITALSQSSVFIKTTSHSLNANVLTNQYGLYIARGIKDANTTLSNKYGLYIETPTGNSDGAENYGIRNNGDLLQGSTAFFATTDWNKSTTTGSALRIGLGASTGNTYSVIQAVSSGNNALNNLFLNPYGGLIGIGLVAATAILHLKASTAAANTASLKIDAGIVATTPVSGNIESDGTHLYWTDSGGTRRTLDNA